MPLLVTIGSLLVGVPPSSTVFHVVSHPLAQAYAYNATGVQTLEQQYTSPCDSFTTGVLSLLPHSWAKVKSQGQLDSRDGEINSYLLMRGAAMSCDHECD